MKHIKQQKEKGNYPKIKSKRLNINFTNFTINIILLIYITFIIFSLPTTYASELLNNIINSKEVFTYSINKEVVENLFSNISLDKNKTNIYFFYSTYCPHCERVLKSKVLDKLDKKEFKVIKINVNEKENQDKFIKVCNILKNNSEFYFGAVPTLVLITKDQLNDNMNNKNIKLFALQGDIPIIKFVNKIIAWGKKEKNKELNNNINNVNNEQSKSSNTKENTKLTFGKILWLTLVTSLADSINPCIMSVLALLISQLMLVKAKKRIKRYSLVYIITIYISYFIIGLLLAYGLNGILTKISLKVNNTIGFYVILIVALIVIFAGIVNIKDFFAYGKGISFQLSKKSKERVMKLVQRLSLISIITLGVIITLIEFPCSGIMYAGFISLLVLHHIRMASIIAILLVYNFIFVLPLILITYFVLKGISLEEIDKTRIKYRRYFRLIMGIVLVCLGIYLLKMAL